jgi:type IV pilus assembly protein PilV
MDMRTQTGFSLVEVMVTLLILNVGLLGVLSAQTLALKQAQDALQRTQAVALASGLLNDIQSNRQLATTIGPQLTLSSELPPVTICNEDVSCTAQQLAANQMAGWLSNPHAGSAAGLIEPVFCLQQNAVLIDLRISWLRRTAGAESSSGCQLTAGRSVLSIQGGN